MKSSQWIFVAVVDVIALAIKPFNFKHTYGTLFIEVNGKEEEEEVKNKLHHTSMNNGLRFEMNSDYVN